MMYEHIVCHLEASDARVEDLLPGYTPKIRICEKSSMSGHCSWQLDLETKISPRISKSQISCENKRPLRGGGYSQLSGRRHHGGRAKGRSRGLNI